LQFFENTDIYFLEGSAWLEQIYVQAVTDLQRGQDEQGTSTGIDIEADTGLQRRSGLPCTGHSDGKGNVRAANRRRQLSSERGSDNLFVEGKKMSGEQRVRQLIKRLPHPDFPVICSSGICQKEAEWKLRSPRHFKDLQARPEATQWRTQYYCDQHAKDYFTSHIEKQQVVRILAGNPPAEIPNPWFPTAKEGFVGAGGHVDGQGYHPPEPPKNAS
jgi:hypothetical protein